MVKKGDTVKALWLGGGGGQLEDKRLVLLSKISTFSEPGAAINFNSKIDNFFLFKKGI